MDIIISESIGFNRAEPRIMLLDINSCFATIEQQANPLLRGKPIVVAAYTTDRGCILAASREAKRYGIKTGMRVAEAKQRIPSLIVIAPDSNKYRYINKKLVQLLSEYSDVVDVKSIDEMIISFTQNVILDRFIGNQGTVKEGIIAVAKEIKNRIRKEIGEWITVSIGIAPNRYLAKIGASYQKPDGLTVIDHSNIESILGSLKLEELCGIKEGVGRRFRTYGIQTPLQMYKASIQQLRYVLHSIVGYHWWLRLHGWEADDREISRRSIGHQYALKHPVYTTDMELRHIIYQLIGKMGRRLREDNYVARGLFVGCRIDGVGWWGERETQKQPLFADSDFYEHALQLIEKAPKGLVRLVTVSCFGLDSFLYAQQCLFPEDAKKERITRALDAISRRWGEAVVVPGRLLGLQQKVQDRVGFGNTYGIDFAMKGVPFD